MSDRTIVKRVEDGVDRRDVEATTYQMRNFYRQFADGFFSGLDTFNYVQHHQIARWCRDGERVLDVCCGRGLMLPLLRYHAKPSLYVGVDIEPRNAVFTRGERVTDGKPVDDGYYNFPVEFVEGNVADLGTLLDGREFDLLIYTSAIEHMHPDAGLASLHGCRAVAAPGARLILTCPNTPEGQDGYAARKRAHVYEWKRSELVDGLAASGWQIEAEWGLHLPGRALQEAMGKKGLGRVYESLRSFIPPEWLNPILAPMFPRESDEIAFLARPVP